ncbi:MAG TPA: TonB-dependent receptor, partial [Pseudidiomarina sp.]|nr:TonB-dependent receptor [Pseudidiomarina sp.]
MFRRHPLAVVIAATIAGSWSPLVNAQAETQESVHHDSDKPEVIVITASPLARTQISSAQPVSVIAGDELREQHAHTLGETLENEPGISSTHFAGVASSPIIRGLDGPRVKVTQNGLDSGDVSRSSPDHAVTTETSVAEQIEILRGPATLLYGSGAIGGIVNVVDNRIAKEPVGGSRGFYGTRFDTASNLREGTVGFSADHKDTVWHFDGFKRRSDDYDVPSFTNDEGEVEDTVENSFIDAQGANFGVSYLFDDGYAGVAYGRLEQDYGIPGHHHGHEESDEHEEHGDEHGVDEHDAEAHTDDVMEEAGPFATLWQNRIQFHAGLYQPWSGIEQAEVRYGFTDYQHQEIEDGAPASTFQNQQNELRVTLTHEPISGWRGAFGYHYFDQDLNAFGEEAYTPPSETTRHGLFWLVEQQFGDLNWQGGIRFEQVDVDAPTLAGNPYSSLSFQPLSASLGFTYQATQQIQFAVNLSHAQRAPSGSELFSDGTHLATQTYELGLVYELHQEGDHAYHVEPSDRTPVEEKSNNIDLGMHFETDQMHLQANLFYNQI